MSSDDIAQSIYICTICHFRYPSYNHLANSRDNERVIHDQAATLLGFLMQIPLLTYSSFTWTKTRDDPHSASHIHIYIKHDKTVYDWSLFFHVFPQKK